MNIATVARMFCILPQTLTYWYRHYLSDYQSDKASGKWHPKTLYDVDEETGEIFTELPLYVFKPENIGEQMCIDDKGIAHEGFTILSNHQTGKMAMMLESTNGKDVEAALGLFGDTLDKVKSISSDMAATYLKACRLLLPMAQVVIDKFHVMQYVYGAIEEVRLRIKKELMAQLSKGKTKTEKDTEILADLEQLRHCRHALSQPPDKWSETGTARMDYLFQKYPEIKTAYDLGQDFRNWYDISNREKNKIFIERDLRNWYYKVEDTKIEEFKSVGGFNF
ncbi:DDE transposase [Bacteroidia bacterium]|nr:DDE transposase [Bacteroidia bacterium]